MKLFLIFLALADFFSAQAAGAVPAAKAAVATAVAANNTAAAANHTAAVANQTAHHAAGTAKHSAKHPKAIAVPVSDLQTNQFLNQLFNWGFNQTITNSIKNGTIPNGSYTVQNVTSITETPVNGGDLYNFHCTANSTPNTTVALAFIVRNTLTSYAAKVA